MTDVIIIGGGITGGALACALAQRGFQVDLLDKGGFQTTSPSDGKSFALSPSSKILFENIGLWETLETITPITTIHTSDGVSAQGLDYGEGDMGQGPLGYVVESSLLKAKLMERLLTYPNISRFKQTRASHSRPLSVSPVMDASLKHERMQTFPSANGSITKSPLCVRLIILSPISIKPGSISCPQALWLSCLGRAICQDSYGRLKHLRQPVC